jgi:hypothetical protein
MVKDMMDSWAYGVSMSMAWALLLFELRRHPGVD